MSNRIEKSFPVSLDGAREEVLDGQLLQERFLQPFFWHVLLLAFLEKQVQGQLLPIRFLFVLGNDMDQFWKAEATRPSLQERVRRHDLCNGMRQTAFAHIGHPSVEDFVASDPIETQKAIPGSHFRCGATQHPWHCVMSAGFQPRQPLLEHSIDDA